MSKLQTPPAMVNKVIAARASGMSKIQIAKALHMSQNTVRKIIQDVSLDEHIAGLSQQLAGIGPDCVTAVHNSVKKGNAQVAMQVIDRLLDIGTQQQTSTFTLNLGALTPGENVSNSPVIDVAGPTQAAKNPRGGSECVTSPAQLLLFPPVSDSNEGT